MCSTRQPRVLAHQDVRNHRAHEPGSGGVGRRRTRRSCSATFRQQVNWNPTGSCSWWDGPWNPTRRGRTYATIFVADERTTRRGKGFSGSAAARPHRKSLPQHRQLPERPTIMRGAVSRDASGRRGGSVVRVQRMRVSRAVLCTLQSQRLIFWWLRTTGAWRRSDAGVPTSFCCLRTLVDGVRDDSAISCGVGTAEKSGT